MHQLTMNAGIQLIPIHTKEHPYEWVDMVIDIIKESGLTYEIGAFNTSVEGSYEKVRQLVDRINDFLMQEQCPEWLLNVQYQLRSESAISIGEKTEKFR
jgi:uncharacterized protein YqgV (UPF0045/DUF77 family)